MLRDKKTLYVNGEFIYTINGEVDERKTGRDEIQVYFFDKENPEEDLKKGIVQDYEYSNGYLIIKAYTNPTKNVNIEELCKFVNSLENKNDIQIKVILDDKYYSLELKYISILDSDAVDVPRLYSKNPYFYGGYYTKDIDKIDYFSKTYTKNFGDKEVTLVYQPGSGWAVADITDMMKRPSNKAIEDFMSYAALHNGNNLSNYLNSSKSFVDGWRVTITKPGFKGGIEYTIETNKGKVYDKGYIYLTIKKIIK